MTGVTGPADRGPTVEDVHRLIACYRAGGLARLDELIAPDYQGVQNGQPYGRPDLFAVMSQVTTAFPDFAEVPLRVVVDGPLAVSEVHITGTHTGRCTDAGGLVVEPTWGRLDFVTALFTEFRAGRVVREVEYHDTATIAAQVGPFFDRLGLRLG